MTIRILYITIFLINFSNSTKSNDNRYMFDFAVDKETPSGAVVSIDAYKSIKNDDLIKANNQENYNRMEWISIGDPQLHGDLKKPFKFTTIGFNMRIQILNNHDKQLIKKEIKEKYDIEVHINQIKRKKLDHIECRVQFNIENKTLTLYGTVQHYNRNPYEVWFNYNENLNENRLLKKFLEEKNSEDLMISCQTKDNQTGQTNNYKIEITTELPEKHLEIEEKFGQIEQKLHAIFNEINKLNTQNNIINGRISNENQLANNKMNEYINQFELSNAITDKTIEDVLTKQNEYENKHAKNVNEFKSLVEKFNDLEQKFNSTINTFLIDISEKFSLLENRNGTKSQ